ncbi:MAG: hypothetical protein WA902_08130 [Thermosynechococcaceae cyanobacterium]
MICTTGVVLTQVEMCHQAHAESALVEQFTERLLGAKRLGTQSQPWVMVTPRNKAPVLLSVYQSLKEQGKLDDWSKALYEVRQDAGICVFALIP